MTNKEKRVLLERAKDYFRNRIVMPHLNVGLKNASKLTEYNVNPFLIKYLAYFLRGNANPESMAEALIYPRILGTSIATSFGSNAQYLISEMFNGPGSATAGIDIEYTDQIDHRKKYCQVKSGPNTINRDDVSTIQLHFTTIRNKARKDKLPIEFDDLVVGVLYGENNELSGHYKLLSKNYAVFVGKDFWHRLTGDENFYASLIDAFAEVALEVDSSKELEKAIKDLAKQIKVHYGL